MEYLDIILFVFIAGIFVYRLYTVLGHRIGHTPDANEAEILSTTPEKIDENENEPEVDKTTKEEVPGINALKQADSNFELDSFKQGAKAAFERILIAIDNKEDKILKVLLAANLFKLIKQEWAGWKKLKQRHVNTLVSLDTVKVKNISSNKNIFRIVVFFESQQTNLIYDENEKIVSGDENSYVVHSENWIFERDVTSDNPNWILVDTQEA